MAIEPRHCDVPGMLKLSQLLRRDRVIASCLTCQHFDEKNELCQIARMRPPAAVIAFGCPSWADDLVPF